MTIFSQLWNRVRKDESDEEIVGTIVEGPTTVEDEKTSSRAVVFRLDSRPDLLFSQPVSALAADRKHGDRVKVHYHLNGDATARVSWTEKA